MKALKARVEQGRLVLDEPTNLPDGTVLELVIADPGHDLASAEIEALNAALVEGWDSARRGELRPAAELIEELRQLD